MFSPLNTRKGLPNMSERSHGILSLPSNSYLYLGEIVIISSTQEVKENNKKTALTSDLYAYFMYTHNCKYLQQLSKS